tara:strand:- start:1429 stop:2094 length:666 start_codon:yes stop_codon:yes gene_type:complete
MGRIFILVMLLQSVYTSSQVGINTTSPLATLDVNGNMALRSVTEELKPSIAKDSILVVSDDGIVKTITANTVVNEAIPSLVRGDFASSGAITLSILSGSSIIPFDQKTIDVLDEFNTSTHVYTAKNDGIYQIYVQIEANGSLAVATDFGVSILHNGVTVATANYANVGILSINATPPFRSTTTLLVLNAGDTVQFNLDSSLLTADLSGSNFNSFFTIHQLR